MKSRLVLFILFGIVVIGGCSTPKIEEVYWAANPEGDRASSSIGWDDLVYAYVVTDNADGEEVRILIRESDLIGDDEVCVDHNTVIENGTACIDWYVGSGDHSFLEGTRSYYITATLISGNQKAQHSDFLYIEK